MKSAMDQGVPSPCVNVCVCVCVYVVCVCAWVCVWVSLRSSERLSVTCEAELVTMVITHSARITQQLWTFVIATLEKVKETHFHFLF